MDKEIASLSVPYDLRLFAIYLRLLILALLHELEVSNDNNFINYNFNMDIMATFRLIETETKSSLSANSTAAVSSLHHHPPSDPIIASVLHSRNNPRPGRLLLENVNNRPQTMDRGTQANADTDTVITEAPTSSNELTNTELYRYADLTNQKLLINDGNNSSVDSLNSADSAKRDSEESAIELVEFHQPMITKDETDGHQNMSNMSNGDGKTPEKPANGTVKEHQVDDDVDRPSCGMECLYFTMQCCECTIM